MSYLDETLPWRIVEPGKTAEGRDTHDEDGNLVIFPYRGRHIVTNGLVPVCEFVYDQEDARRIVACVNACKGIPTEALECQAKKDLTAKLIEQHQALLAALEGCVEQIEQMRGMFDDSDSAIQAALENAQKAIDMATGGAT
ncbi:hypothetical protein [Sulfuricystis multivorans]|uniref:hypothetical protein n=1 Tax=Sulfuricystis multivorans TaxID=2211108 RepID=UPI000F84CB26|nr:hypothetical protein [Sulfuricystis multivorans]